jgi:hypothetical protein
VVLVLILATLTVACAGTAITLRLFGLIVAAKVAVAATMFTLVLTVGSVGLAEWRYQNCVDDVDRACPHNACSNSYNGPFIPDCKRMRVFG